MYYHVVEPSAFVALEKIKDDGIYSNVVVDQFMFSKSGQNILPWEDIMRVIEKKLQ